MSYIEEKEIRESCGKEFTLCILFFSIETLKRETLLVSNAPFKPTKNRIQKNTRRNTG